MRCDRYDFVGGSDLVWREEVCTGHVQEMVEVVGW